MNSNQKNFRPTQREIDDVTKQSRRDAFRGSVLGGIGGALVGGKFKKKLVGALAGGVGGNVAGRAIGRREGAKDVVKSRAALLQNMSSRLGEIEGDFNRREFDRVGNDFPGASGQHPVRSYPHARGPFVPGNGIDDQEAYEMSPLRQKLTQIYGYGIVSALGDDELSEENCRALRDQVLNRQAKAGGPRASSNTDPEFERHFLESKLGQRAVSEMPDSLVHCHFLSAQRRGLVEFEDQSETTDFALINRTRNDEGEFTPEGQVNSVAVQRAYARNPRERRTGISTAIGAGGIAAGLAGAVAHLRGKRRRAPRLTAGSSPALPGAIGADFAANNDGSHPVRDTLAGVGAGALGVAAALALRKRRQLRLPTGVPKLPPRTIDVETETLSRRLPFLTSFAMGHPGKYPIKRRALRGKKPPTHVRPVSVGKAKKHSLAFLIQDDDFPLVPMKQPKLAPGMRQRVPVAKSRAEVLRRLRAMTQLSIGSAVAEGAVDALGIGEATTPKRKKLMVDANGNVINPKFLPTPDTTSQSSFASAIARLHQFGFGPVAGRLAAEGGVIAGADLTAEELHDAIQQARDKKKRLRQRGGIQATPGMGTAPGVQTTMSAVHDTLLEFDHGNARIDRAKRNGTSVAAAGAGGVAGAIGGLKYDQGSPVAHSDLKPGDRVYRRFGPGGLFQHSGVVDESGRVVHRTAGSSKLRSVKPDSFSKTGKAPTYRESNPTDLPRGKAARNASKAAGTRAGKYCVGSNNCQTAVERIASKGRPVSGQIRRAGIGAAVGAIGAGTVASILNRRKDNRGNH